MCGLFGMIDYKNSFTAPQKSKILAVLAKESEARGTNASGIAYNTQNHLCIYKRPIAAGKLRFTIPYDTRIVMGHTRLTTQGSEKKNGNNHPFYGKSGKTMFSLAHNGVIHNDKTLRIQKKLPKTKIQTDSYIAVQLIEQKKTLDFNSLKYMAEAVEGSFSFTLLDDKNNLYFVKGDSPICIYHFKAHGFYLYASTEEILTKAVNHLKFSVYRYEKLTLSCGDILRIDGFGRTMTDSFDATSLCYDNWRFSFPSYNYSWFDTKSPTQQDEMDDYIEEIKSMAGSFGYLPEDIDYMLESGFTVEEIEDVLYNCI